MTRQEFEEKLSSLISEFEKDNEEVELYFAYFSDDLDKVRSWEDNGFVFGRHPSLVENERNYESELRSIKGSLISVPEEDRHWFKLDKDKIGVKIIK